MIVIADTGALYALMDKSDAWHARVLDWWQENGATVVVPSVVLSELCYLLQTRIGPAAEHAFVKAVGDGEFALEELAPEDVSRAADVMEQYDNFPLGYVDAAIVAAAERMWARDVLTTDRRHFGVIRPKHARSFALLP